MAKRKKIEEPENIYDNIVDLASESGIDLDLLLEKISNGIMRAITKEFPDFDEDEGFVRIDVDKEARRFRVLFLRTVVEDEPTYINEINIEEARAIPAYANCMPGDVIEFEMPAGKLGRVAASSAKQSLKGDIREIERSKIIEVFEDKTKEIVPAEVIRIDPSGHAILHIKGAERYDVNLFRKDMIPGESITVGQTITVYVDELRNKEKRPYVAVTRTSFDFVRRLFEREINEIREGIVEIKAISRDAGSRTKIAVMSNNPDVDPIGACIGENQSRINAIKKELNYEKIDLIPYDADPATFVKNAIAPAKAVSVEIAEGDEKICRVKVPANQLSLAIGNKGQNAKLAAKLTGYKVDISAGDSTPTEKAAEEETAAEPTAESEE